MGKVAAFIAEKSLMLIQIIISFVMIKGYWTYWCYTFVSVNRKQEMDIPLWQRQVEQTTSQKKYPGWYHPYWHKMPKK